MNIITQFAGVRAERYFNKLVCAVGGSQRYTEQSRSLPENNDVECFTPHYDTVTTIPSFAFLMCRIVCHTDPYRPLTYR